MGKRDDADRHESEDEESRPEVTPDPDLISYRHEVVKPRDGLESYERKTAPETEARAKEPARR